MIIIIMSGQRDGRTSGFRAPPSYLVFLLPYASNTPFTTQKPHGMFSQPTRPGLQCFCKDYSSYCCCLRATLGLFSLCSF